MSITREVDQRWAWCVSAEDGRMSAHPTSSSAVFPQRLLSTHRSFPVVSDDWEIGCSDDENYGLKQNENGKWEPSPDIIVALYERLDRNENIELDWKCPGRREPTPELQDEPEEDMKEDEIKPQEKDEYLDFEDEKGQLRLRPSGDIGPRGSAKKKTTSLDAILSNMERHRRLDMMEQDPPE